jgi:hypothetical protein
MSRADWYRVGVEPAEASKGPFLGHWTRRLPGGDLRHGPVWLWIGVTTGIVSIYAALEVAFGDPAVDWGEAAGPAARWWRVLVLAVLTGFVLFASRWAIDGSRRDVEQLRPLLRCSNEQFASFVRSLYVYDPGRMYLCAAIGVGVGLALIPLTTSEFRPFVASDWSHEILFAAGLNAVLFWILGRESWGTVEVTRLFSRLEQHLGPVDLLEPRALAPFAHRGLRSAAVWLGGSAIASLLFPAPGYRLPVFGVIIATVALGVVALVLPTRAVHLRLRRERDTELARVRSAIRREREAVLQPDPIGEAESAAIRLPGLLAYEARIASASVWPFDTSTLVRFTLLLVLALGSWIGGAIVERFVSALLG